MNDSDDLPLACPKCHAETRKSLRWVQENTFFTCASCGAAVLIDKDAAMKLLAELHRDSE
jgi:peptide subunit release factor 1 (eRF1)